MSAKNNNETFDPTMQDNDEEMVTLGQKPTGKSQRVLQRDFNTLNTPAVRDASIGGLQLSAKAQKTKEKLAKEPKVTIMIPLDMGEKAGEAYRPVCINGYRFEIKKNVMVAVPRSVAALVQNSYNIENSIFSENEYNLDRKDSKTRSALDA